MYQPRFRKLFDSRDATGRAAQADVCWLAHAGGGTATLASGFRTLERPLPVDIYSPQLPMRETLAEIEYDGDLVDLSRQLADGWAEDRSGEGQAAAMPRPLVLIGHSFGSVLGYCMAGELARRGIHPHRLVVLSYPSPDATSHDPELHTMEDETFIQQVDALFGGIPDHLRTDKQAQAFFLPALRMDLRLLQQFQQPEAEPLACPIVAICGNEDRVVNMAQMQSWQRFTSDSFRLRSMPGGHFFPTARLSEVLRIALWDVLPG